MKPEEILRVWGCSKGTFISESFRRRFPVTIRSLSARMSSEVESPSFARMVKLILLPLLCILSAGGMATAGELNLFDGHYVIVTSRNAIPVEATAAKELADYLHRIGNITLPVVAEPAAGTSQILVGPSDTVKKLLPEVDFARLKADEIIIRTVGDRLILAGGRPRGTLYAVYTFLEDQAGCRWWTSTERFIPQKKELLVGDLNLRYVPPFIYRESFYTEVNNNPDFAACLKVNGHHNRIGPDKGGHLEILGFVHTADRLLPPEKYFAKHPEWYSEINGKRRNDAQLCLTNPEMRAELVKNALAWIDKNPHAGFISISQNDRYDYCTCPKCRALDEAEGSPSGSLLTFVNAVAAEIEKKYPDMLVETLAYQYTRQPPKTVKPRHNVVIRLCSIECDFLRPLTDPANAGFQKDIEGWKKISSQLYIWDYVTDFSQYLMPHPNLQVIGPNLRYFAANNVIGVFEEGDYGSTVGEFLRMRAWVMAHLLWNPQADADALTDEFLQGYYGAAAPFLKEYLKVIRVAAERDGKAMGCFHRNVPWLTVADQQAALNCFARAAAAVKDDPVLCERVRREKLPLLVAILESRMPKKGRKDSSVQSESAAMAREVIAIAEKYQCEQFREGGPFRKYREELENAFLRGQTK